MGRRPKPITAVLYKSWPAITGVVVAGLLLAFGLFAIIALIGADDNASFLSIFTKLDHDRLFYSLRSAFGQALLSVFFSLLLAIPVAIALTRLAIDRSKLQRALSTLLVVVISLAMVLPTTVAATGLLAVWGRNGMMAQSCGALFGDCPDLSIYGLQGVVIAHMMLNVPLMVRVFMPLLSAIPAVKWRQSAMLGFGMWPRFLHIEWQAIKAAILGISTLVFLLCFTSFSLVLMLGGGPKVTTLEVEIYSAVRFDFDLAAAAGLSLIQFFCAGVVVMVLTISSPDNAPKDIKSSSEVYWRIDLNLFDKMINIAAIALIVFLVVLPMVMVVLGGINLGLWKLLNRPQFWSSLGVSLSIASISAVVVTILAFLMAQSRAHLSLSYRQTVKPQYSSMMKTLLDAGVMLYLVIPSVVLGTSSFIILRGYGDVMAFAFGVVVAANILLALPFAVRLLDRRLTTLTRKHDRLAISLGIKGMTRLRVLTLPPLKRDLGVILGITAALSVGDLGVIALFAHDGFKTLPWMLYQLAGKYATGEAAGLALVLMLLTVLMFAAGRLMMRVIIGGRYA